jgi:hypothetical protein
LQEYFAAQFIFLDAKEMQHKILEKIYNNPYFIQYYNLLELYYDIDYKGFRRCIIYNLLCEFKKFSLMCNIDNNSTILEKRNCELLFNGFPLFYYSKEEKDHLVIGKIIDWPNLNLNKYLKFKSIIQLPKSFYGFTNEKDSFIGYSLFSNKYYEIFNFLSNENFISKFKRPNRENDDFDSIFSQLMIEEGSA